MLSPSWLKRPWGYYIHQQSPWIVIKNYVVCIFYVNSLHDSDVSLVMCYVSHLFCSLHCFYWKKPRTFEGRKSMNYIGMQRITRWKVVLDGSALRAPTTSAALGELSRGVCSHRTIHRTTIQTQAVNISSTVCRTNESRWLLVTSSSRKQTAGQSESCSCALWISQ